MNTPRYPPPDILLSLCMSEITGGNLICHLFTFIVHLTCVITAFVEVMPSVDYCCASVKNVQLQCVVCFADLLLPRTANTMTVTMFNQTALFHIGGNTPKQ